MYHQTIGPSNLSWQHKLAMVPLMFHLVTFSDALGEARDRSWALLYGKADTHPLSYYFVPNVFTS